MEKDSRWWVSALSPGLAGFESEGRAARSVSQSSGSTARGDAASEGGAGKKVRHDKTHSVCHLLAFGSQHDSCRCMTAFGDYTSVSLTPVDFYTQSRKNV